jgi:hypothetical protein
MLLDLVSRWCHARERREITVHGVSRVLTAIKHGVKIVT